MPTAEGVAHPLGHTAPASPDAVPDPAAAHLGRRALAAAADLGVAAALTVLVAAATGLRPPVLPITRPFGWAPLDDPLGRAAGVALVLSLAWWAVPLVAEPLTGGSTPGKRLLGLTVRSADSSPAGVRALLVRNAWRGVDMIPAAYGLGLLAAARGERLGDLLAGTRVSLRSPADVPLDTALARLAVGQAGAPAAAAVPLSLSPGTVALARRFAVRRWTLDADARDVAARAVAARIRIELAGAPVGPALHDDEALVDVVVGAGTPLGRVAVGATGRVAVSGGSL
ncbi:MAG: hypothetical protein JWM48_78 [Mycobacterium sp.]|nr:hypothetical protein [Mycobacterium sp.]